MSFNWVCNHPRVIRQIGLPLRGRPILLITRLIIYRIGLHSVLLPLLIINKETIGRLSIHKLIKIRIKKREGDLEKNDAKCK